MFYLYCYVLACMWVYVCMYICMYTLGFYFVYLFISILLLFVYMNWKQAHLLLRFIHKRFYMFYMFNLWVCTCVSLLIYLFSDTFRFMLLLPSCFIQLFWQVWNESINEMKMKDKERKHTRYWTVFSLMQFSPRRFSQLHVRWCAH